MRDASSRNGTPGFRFTGTEEVGVACFRISFAPFFLFDQSERLLREPAGLPGLNCSADRPCSEVDCDAEYSMRSPRRARRIAGSVAREFLPAELDRDRPALRPDVMAASARETFTMARQRMQRGLFTVEAAVSAAKRTRHACHHSYRGSRVGCSNLDCTAQAARLPLQLTLFGSARSESIAAADASTAPEHRAAHPRPLQAQGRSCHLSGRYR